MHDMQNVNKDANIKKNSSQDVVDERCRSLGVTFFPIGSRILFQKERQI